MRNLTSKNSNNKEVFEKISFLEKRIFQMEQNFNHLQETQRLFDEFMERSPIYIFFKDDRIRSIRLSRNYEKMLGKPIDELIGKTMDEVFPSDLAKSMIADDLKILESGEDLIVEEELNGRIYTTAKFPINYEGKSRYLAGYTIDITKQKRAEKALIDSEERFRKIFYICPDTVCISRLKDGTIIMINEAFTKIMGYTCEEAIGNTMSHCNIWKNIEDREKIFAELIEKGEIINYEADLLTKDRNVIHALISASSVELSGIPFVISITKDISKHKIMAEELNKSLHNLRHAIGATIQALISAMESKDIYTAGHQRRMADLARSIATKMSLSKDMIEGLRVAATIHDIGKLTVPSEILSKPGKLSSLEFSLIKEHAQNGYEILKDVKSPWPLAEIVHQHHERLDGTGYPKGLRGENICLEARILAVADVVEAMSSHRPYRPAQGIKAAIREIKRNKGKLYDPDVVDACLELFHDKKFQFKKQ